jgi:hypothetical protein
MKHLLLFFCIGLVLSILFSSGQIENPDTALRLTQTRILTENFKFGLPADVGEDSHGNIAINDAGQRYMVYNPGQSLVFLPLYYVAQFISINDAESYYTAAFMVSFINYIILSLCAFLLFRIALSLKVPKKKALLVALVFCLTSYSFSFAQSTYEHHFEMLFILLAYFLVTSENINQKYIYAGLAIGIGVIFRSTTILAIPGILLLITNNKQRLYFLLNIIPGVCIILFYNYYRFGNPLETGYGFAWQLANSEIEDFWSLSRIPGSIFGFLFSPGKGLLIFSPTILISLLGIRKFWVKYRKLAQSIIVLCILYLFLFSMNFAWHGSIWSFGPRYILPLVPFLYLPLIEVNVKKWMYSIFLIAGLSQVLLISVNYKRDVLEQYLKLGEIDQNDYIYDINNLPYIAQGRQLIKILPKNISGELENYYVNYPWKKEIRNGTGQEVLMYSIEKNAINFWWVRAFLLGSNFLQKIVTILSLILAIIGIFYIVNYVKKNI